MTDPALRRRIAPLVRRGPRSTTERLLDTFGVDPAFSEQLLGDMAEEREFRAVRDGVAAARLWYLGETLRAVPHVGWSWVRYSRTHAPLRLVALAAAIAIAPAGVLLARSLRDGPPARFAGARDGGIVVNSLRPVRLPMAALDAAGHVLKGARVRYRWVSGVPATVSPDGVVTCTTRGDAQVRVSAGHVATRVSVLCRPVRSLVASEAEMSFVVGQPDRPIGVSAVDATGRVVSQITGTLTIVDTTVARLLHGPAGYRVEPRAPGRTFVAIHVGDHGTTVMVQVYPLARTLEGMLRDQEGAAVAVRLGSGETRQWHLSPGRYLIASLPWHSGGPAPGLAVLGANCDGGGWTSRLVCVAGPNALLIAYHQPRAGVADTVAGYIALQRAE